MYRERAPVLAPVRGRRLRSESATFLGGSRGVCVGINPRKRTQNYGTRIFTSGPFLT